MISLSNRLKLCAAAILALLVTGNAPHARAQFIVNGPNGPVMVDDDEDFMMDQRANSMSGESYINTRFRQQITTILQGASSPATANAWTRYGAVEDGLVALTSASLPALQSEMANRSGQELDAMQVARFRLLNAPFNPRSLLTDWAQDRFHYAPDPQAPFHPPPVVIARVLNISAGDLLFPHHLFYVVQWTPTHARIPVAIATDGKVQPLEDDAALAHFLHAEAAPQHTDAGKQLVADAALFLAIARSSDLLDHPIPHSKSHSATVEATLTDGSLHPSITLTFGEADLVQRLTSAPAAAVLRTP